MQKSTAFFLIGLAFSLRAWAQPYAAEIEKISREDSLKINEHSIATATWRSTMIPGWGQLYNKKYWKAPVVWAAMGTTIGFAVFNHGEFKRYQNALDLRVDGNSETIDEFEGLYNNNQLILLENTYRRWRDLSIILTVGVYALNILDAYVDAHLFYFDVSDDLSLQIQPTLWQVPGAAQTGSGLKLSLALK